MSKKKVIIVVSLILFLSLVHLMAALFLLRQWRESKVGSITTSHKSVYLTKGEYIIFLRGKDESKVSSFISSLSSGVRFISAEDEKISSKKNFQYKGTRTGFYQESIGVIKIELPGTYALSDINMPEDIELLIIRSTFDSYFIWTFVFLGLFYIPITLYIFWGLKDWYVFRWFVKSVSGISIGETRNKKG